jgi:hypothetical protein
MTHPGPGESRPTTVGGRVKAFFYDLGMARALKAGYGDQAAINRDLERITAAEKTAAEASWAEIRADGVAVAEPVTALEQSLMFTEFGWGIRPPDERDASEVAAWRAEYASELALSDEELSDEIAASEAALAAYYDEPEADL